MNILDIKIRVEMNTWGGVALHIPATEKRAAFCIWNTAGKRWGVTYPAPQGTDGCKWVQARYYDTPVDAFWAELGFSDVIFHDEVLKLGLVRSQEEMKNDVT